MLINLILLLCHLLSMAHGVVYGIVIPPVQALPPGEKFSLECLSFERVQWIFYPEDWLANRVRQKNVVEPPYTYSGVAGGKTAGDYRCWGKYPNGSSFFAYSKLYVAELRRNRIQPAYIEVNQGARVIFECKSNCYIPEWVHSNGTLGVEYPYTYAFRTLEIQVVTSADAGIYVCYVEEDKRKYLSRAELVVFDNSKIRPRFQRIEEGDSATILCGSDGVATWTFNGEEVPTLEVNKTYGIYFPRIVDTDGIYFPRVDKSMEGVYICRRTTGQHSFALGGVHLLAKSILLVNRKNQSKTIIPVVFPSEQIAKVRSKVQFYCDERTIIGWTFNNSIVLPKNAIVRGRLKRTLKLYYVTPQNSGPYTCVYRRLKSPQTNNVGLLKVIP